MQRARTTEEARTRNLFCVPEHYRLAEAGPMSSDASFGNNGAFCLPAVGTMRDMICIASDGSGWEHVSTRAVDAGGIDRIPTWDEMCRVKDAFWGPEAVVVQYHPRRSAYVNDHPCVLHLWRPIGAAIPEPDPFMVGRWRKET